MEKYNPLYFLISGNNDLKYLSQSFREVFYFEEKEKKTCLNWKDFVSLMEARQFTSRRDLRIVFSNHTPYKRRINSKETRESQLKKYRDKIVKRCVEKTTSLRKSEPRLVVVYTLCFTTLLWLSIRFWWFYWYLQGIDRA